MMKRFLCGLGVFSVLGLIGAGCMTGGPTDVDEDEVTGEAGEQDLAPTGRSGGLAGAKDQQARASSQAGTGGTASAVNQYGIRYHNGPVMTNPIKIYYIWYGNWSDAASKSILTDFASTVGGSPWWNINTTYTNGTGTKVSGQVTLAGQTTDNYSQGTALSDAQILAAVTNAINGGTIGAADPDGIYFLLTSGDVTATSGFCSQYCGWHDVATIGGKKIKYSFVGKPDACLAGCAAQSASSPNGNPAVDAMVSIVAHEAAEAATDPELTAWYDTTGYENADKCAWTFGTQSTAANGSTYNMTLGARKFLVQRNWANVPTKGKCTMTYP